MKFKRFFSMLLVYILVFTLSIPVSAAERATEVGELSESMEVLGTMDVSGNDAESTVNVDVSGNGTEVQEVVLDKYDASQTEIEANGTLLSLNVPATGVLSTSSEEDWYIFNVTQKGYFEVSLKASADADADEIDDGWDYAIYKKGDLQNSLKSYSKVTNSHVSAKLPMEAGTYYVRVKANNIYYDMYAPTGCPYEITARFTASDAWETEANNTNTTYNTIAANKDYQGTLYNSTDVDWFRVDTPANGTIQIDFSSDVSNDVDAIEYGWNVVIYDKDFNALKYYTGITGNYTSQVLPFDKGTFYIKVYAKNDYYAYAPTDCIYHLNLKCTPSSVWESEQNHTKDSADVMLPNQTYSGLLHYSGDVDMYRVTTTQNGYFKVVFDVDSSVNNEAIDWGWDMTVMDKDLNVIKTFSKITQDTTTPIFPYAKGTYYIKVCANYDYSDSYAPTDCIYNLMVKQTKSSTWESEGNDTLAKADSISLGKKYSGIFTHCKDVDWYKVSVSAQGTLQIKLNKGSNVTADDVNWGWDVIIYRGSTSNEVAKLTGIKSSSKVNVDVKKGKYYILVKPNYNYSDSYAPTQCTYNLTANYTKAPAAVKLSSATGGKKQVTLKWKKVSKASGYYVYRSTSKNGTYKKVATIKKGSTTKYVDKKLKAKTKYYYKVKAYTTTKGLTAEGSFSKVKYATTKK